MQRSRNRGAYLAIGVGVGAAIGAAMHRVALGVALCVVFGPVLAALAARREGR
jgi:uncharacterized membrane protein